MPKRLLVIVVALGLLGLLFLGFKLDVLPQHYSVREDLVGITVFWHDDEAFVFVNHMAFGHRHNWLTDRRWKLLHFTGADVYRRPADMIGTTAAALGLSVPHYRRS